MVASKTQLVAALSQKLVFDVGLFVVRDADAEYEQIRQSRWSLAEIQKEAIHRAAIEKLASL